MITQNHFVITCSSYLFILVVLFIQPCCCTNPSHICSPSACGDIHNISFPFRLDSDPRHCGDHDYELSCENNFTTILYLNSQRYKVKAINYINNTIWLADTSVSKDNICSFPNVSLYSYILRDTIAYDTFYYNYYSVDAAMPINYMRCPYPLKNSSLFFKELPICNSSPHTYNYMRCPYPLKNSSLFFTELPTHCNSSPYTYIKVGHMNALYVRDNCTVDTIVLTSWKFKDLENISVSEIHDSLLYGFQLTWHWLSCIFCNGKEKCGDLGVIPTCSRTTLWDYIYHPNHGPEGSAASSAVILILLLSIGLNGGNIAVVVFAGVSLPVKIILGLASACGFIIIEMKQDKYVLNVYWPVAHLRLIIGLFFAVRFIIVLPFMMWFLINKFRSRHRSRYDAIEDFLQSDNGLMPIRYSYSDIKKLTRGFREKLGQGGYGTVYKGKLRSGYDVAVKLLGKPGGNGQDFINEIATMGRIHHLNVVNLVGYCAEGSKRALVFDFMPNGSLDKYIFCREETRCLGWERKYEIAVGVARGIAYLHKGCNIQILHFDIKPHNILLDDNFTPKITDFGLAKFYSTDKNLVTLTAVRGTIGYVAPELINRGFGGVSYKADVYSFGMLLMEMVGLNRDCKQNNCSSSQYFPCWIYDCFEKGEDIKFEKTNEIIDDDDDNYTNTDIAKKITIVALWCIQMSPGDRPSMNKVVEMLEAPVERLQVPNRPSQSAHVAVNFEDHSWSTYSTDSISLNGHNAAPSVEIIAEA